MKRKEHFVKLTLSSNDQPIWIKIESIVAFYADSNLNGEAVTKIHTMDDDYSIVKETPDFIHYAIDEYFNPEWYKEACDEESRECKDLMDESIHRDMEKLTLSESYGMIQNFIARKTQCDGCVREKNCNENFEVCVYLAACKKLEEALRKAGEL